MKNHVFLLLFVVGVLGCDRLKVDETSQIKISLPGAENVLAAKPVTAFGGRPVPTGFTGSLPINCYLIAAGGPEADMQKNLCGRKDAAGKISTSGSFAPRKIGPWIGAAPAGSAISLDVPSGKDRVIYVVGFHAMTAADCRDFRTYGFPDDEMSNPYLVGEKGGLELKPGETKDLPIEVAFNPTNEFDSCQGPDFPEDSHNGGGGGGNPPTQLAVVKDHFPYQSYQKGNSCESFDLILKTATGSHTSFSTSTNFTVNVTMDIAGTPTPTTVYRDRAECLANTPVSTFAFPANKDRMQVYFKLDENAASVMIAPTFPLPITVPAMFATYGSSEKLLDLEGPNYLVPSLCYPMNLKMKLPNNNGAMGYASITSSPGFKVYPTGYDCENSINERTGSLSYLSAQMPVYGKLLPTANSTEGIALNSTDSGGVVATSINKYIYRGSGSATPSSLYIMGHNQIPASTCATNAHEVVISNQNGFPVPVTVATNVVVTGSDGTVELYDSPSCGSSATGTLSLPVMAGSHSVKFYVKVNQANSQKSVQATSSFGSAAYTINVGNP